MWGFSYWAGSLLPTVTLTPEPTPTPASGGGCTVPAKQFHIAVPNCAKTASYPCIPNGLGQEYGTVFGTTWNTEDSVRRRATGLLKPVANSDHRSLLGLPIINISYILA